MTMARKITAVDIMDMDEYGAVRRERRRELVAAKRNRRAAIGPHATAHFENFETMLAQVHEMLFIEKGGEEQLADELEAYNPLIPNGRELVITLLFEIDNPEQRRQFLSNLGGVEETLFITVGEERIEGTAEEDVDRTTADGKASSVQFIHFAFTDAQAAAFKSGDKPVMLGISHPAYPHSTTLNADQVAALAADFD